jgi:hypothetical protein
MLLIPRIIIFALPVITGTLAGTALAQERAGVSQQEVQSAATARGLSLIEEITVEARALRLPENRAFVQAVAAELLWTHDEKRARSLFLEALSNMGDITSGVAQDDPEFTRLEQIAEDLRREVLLKVARHDSSWARELIRATSQPSPQVDVELQLELSSAAQMTANPRQAAPDGVYGRDEGLASLPETKKRAGSTDVPTGASPEILDGFYAEAAADAQSAGDFDRARQMASHIRDQFQRGETLAAINQQYLLDAARAGKVEQTLSSLALLHTPEERASMLVELALAVAQRNEKERALELITQARNLLGNQPRNYAQIKARLRVACTLAMLDPDQSFEMIGMIVNQLDELARATTVVDGFITEEQFTRNNELILKQILQFLDTLSDESAQDIGLASLAAHEFARLKNATDKFQHMELRILAHLSLAESVLTQETTSFPRQR